MVGALVLTTNLERVLCAPEKRILLIHFASKQRQFLCSLKLVFDQDISLVEEIAMQSQGDDISLETKLNSDDILMQST